MSINSDELFNLYSINKIIKSDGSIDLTDFETLTSLNDFIKLHSSTQLDDLKVSDDDLLELINVNKNNMDTRNFLDKLVINNTTCSSNIELIIDTSRDITPAASSEMMTPASSEIMTPASSEIMTPASSEMMAPAASSGMMAPAASSEMMAPASIEMMAPAASSEMDSANIAVSSNIITKSKRTRKQKSNPQSNRQRRTKSKSTQQ